MKFEYSMPNTSPLYVPPPYHYKGNNILNVVFKTTSDLLRDLLPPPLTPNPDDLAFFYVGELKIDSPVTLIYKEAGIGIPAIFNGNLGSFYAYMYLDSSLAIVAGREIWGFPKKDAAITYAAEKDGFQASVKRDGIEIIRASLKVIEEVKPVPPVEDLPSFSLKIIPSVIRNHPPDVFQLTSGLSSSTRIELNRGEATITFTSSPNDLLGKIPILDIISAEQYIGDMSLNSGEVLVDYLKEQT